MNTPLQKKKLQFVLLAVILLIVVLASSVVVFMRRNTVTVDYGNISIEQLKSLHTLNNDFTLINDLKVDPVKNNRVKLSNGTISIDRIRRFANEQGITEESENKTKGIYAFITSQGLSGKRVIVETKENFLQYVDPVGVKVTGGDPESIYKELAAKMGIAVLPVYAVEKFGDENEEIYNIKVGYDDKPVYFKNAKEYAAVLVKKGDRITEAFLTLVSGAEFTDSVELKPVTEVKSETLPNLFYTATSASDDAITTENPGAETVLAGKMNVTLSKYVPAYYYESTDLSSQGRLIPAIMVTGNYTAADFSKGTFNILILNYDNRDSFF